MAVDCPGSDPVADVTAGGLDAFTITYISYVENILLLIHAIFEEKSVMYLQTTTIDHVNFYMPNTVLRPTRRLFYASH